MEMKSPPPCPSTVTVRRNPLRKARIDPSSVVRLGEPLSTPSVIPPFPIQDILSVELPQNPNPSVNNTKKDPATAILTENLKVYLRIRPLTVQSSVNAKRIAESKNAWPKNPKNKTTSRSKLTISNEVCVKVNDDLCSVTVLAPQSIQETKRIKSEVYNGFSRVFPSEASQSDVYEEMVKPLVDDFIKGKCGMLAAMGPSGSGKTHTVFGCGREPGMVPLALRSIFSENQSSGKQFSREYYLSMMEICSERGKSEKIIDLLHDGGDIYMQQSVVKGIQETVVCDAQHAESLIASGMLKRATATTNSNNHSSRSQCIINIRGASKKSDGEVDGKVSTMLTIVDLAGAEKEKKTGNQGARLFESNFINNTSMVLGLCLRSLLEHQKNRNKILPKHYHNSLLTRYMRDYLEGKKRMTLILTVKPGIEDYPDTSFVLRQASPFANIKFKNIEDPVNLICSKRPNQDLPRAEQLKRTKFNDNGASLIDEGNISKGLSTQDCKKIAGDVINHGLENKIEGLEDENLTEIPVLSAASVVLETRNNIAHKGHNVRNKAGKEREYKILQGLSKALWTILKQNKKELEVLKIDNWHLRDNLSNEKSKSLHLENELTSERMRLLELENELKDLKIRCSSRKSSTNVLPVSIHDATTDLSQYQMTELQEVNLDVFPYYRKELEQTANDKETDNSVIDASALISCSSGDDRHYNQEFRRPSESNVNPQDVEAINDSSTVDVCSISQDLSVCTNDAQEFGRPSESSVDPQDINDTSTVDACPRSQDLSVCTNDNQDSNSCSTTASVDCEVTTQSTSACLYSSHSCEQVVQIMGDEKSSELETESVSNESICPTPECGSVDDSPHDDLRDAKGKLTQLQNNKTGDKCQVVRVAAHADNALHSSVPLQTNCKVFYMDEEQPIRKEDKPDLQVRDLPSEGRDVKVMSNSVPKLSSCSTFQHSDKPKRRLLPASSVLLKDISMLDVKDENDKPKGKGRKMVPMGDKYRTQGSLSLLHLLKTNLNQ